MKNNEPPVISRHKLEVTGGLFAPGKEGWIVKMVVVSAPKALSGLLKKLFHIK